MPIDRKLKTLPTRKKRASKVLEALRLMFPESGCSLEYDGAWQLLVATILSAQCTDVRVNVVTPGIFERFPTVRDFAEAPREEIEDAVRSTGFFRNKAKSIQGAAQTIIERHDGQVPSTIGDLVKVPGAGRKTANVVLGEIWNAPDGVVVDTHVGRVSYKLGLTDQKDPVKVERQLNECLPQADWRDFGHLLIDLGRKTCRARAPRCDECPVYRYCEVRA